MKKAAYKKSIHNRILLLVLGVVSIGAVVYFYLEYTNVKRGFIEERLNASRFIAEPIINDINTDMLMGNPYLVRHLVEDLSAIEDIESIQIIRNNGVEAAFMDLKTIEKVKEKLGGVEEPEWYRDHEDLAVNIAEGVDTPEFKAAFETYKKDWTAGPKHYIDDEGRTLTYLQPIAEKDACAACHTLEGARGVLMVTTSLEDMYEVLTREVTLLALYAVFVIPVLGVLLSILVKRSVTGPLQRTVAVIDDLEKDWDLTKRVEVTSDDEVGYLSKGFNRMLGALQIRDKENLELLWSVEKSKEEWETTFDAIGDMIAILDVDYNVIKTNKAFRRRFKLTEGKAVGRKCYEVIHGTDKPCEDCPHAVTMEYGWSSTLETFEPKFDKYFNITTFPILGKLGDKSADSSGDGGGNVVATVLLAKDVTEEKRLKEQLMHAEKMGSLGKFVAGIAHEINNPLTGIMGFSQILMDSPEDMTLGEVKDKLTKIYQESLRTSKIMKNLLTFSSAKEPTREAVDINAIIRDTVELKDYSEKHDFKFEMDLSGDIPLTMADYFQLQQVFINVINNAVDAVRGLGTDGRVEVSTRLSGDVVEIVFSDNGPGIPDALKSKLFDPFFTTKEVGMGTGLGLSICHSLIQEHGGRIEIKNGENRGTFVLIELPITEVEEAKADEPSVDGGVQDASAKGAPRSGPGGSGGPEKDTPDHSA